MKAFVNGITMAYDDIGTGPAVLLIHGFPLSRRMWEPQVGPLVDAGFRVITPDLRGFGESEVPESGYDMNTFADDIVALLNYLGVGRAVIGGMSMGGYVLLNLLERYRQRVAAAGFFVTRSRADDVAEKNRRSELAELVGKGQHQVVIDALGSLLFDETSMSNRPELVTGVLKSMEFADSRGLAGGLRAMAKRKDYTANVRAFDLPALVISAERDRCVPPEHSRFLAAALPNCTSHVITAAGHMVNIERPVEFNGCLLAFLNRLAAEKQRGCRLRKVA